MQMLTIHKILQRMKKALILLLLMTGLGACENQDKEFPDFDYNAVYFPVQFPVRTLSLGNDDIDNSLDKELKFHIGISIGGMYQNTSNWKVQYEVDESLCDSLGNDVLPLPSSYYTLDPAGEVTIAPGSFSGYILVQLTDAFLADSLATGNHYVVPLRITSTNADSILTGLPAISNPDKRVISDWNASAPAKDFTLYMIKYVNEYHGTYLRRGVDYGQDAFGKNTDTTTYHGKYVENDEIVELSTISRDAVKTGFIGAKVGANFAFRINVSPSSGDVTVETDPASQYKIAQIGTGKYVPGGDTWGGRPRDVIYLNYKYRVGIYNHQVFDTLVFRDRGIAYEEFSPEVISGGGGK